MHSSFTLVAVVLASLAGTTVGSPSDPAKVSAALPQSTEVSTTGMCGIIRKSTKGLSCEGSNFGPCCSHWGKCGTGASFCGEGCQTLYGACGSAASPDATVPKPASD